MPTMLGLTNDPSPHGLNAKKSKSKSKSKKQESDGQLVPRGPNGITPKLNTEFFNGEKREESDSEDDDNPSTIAGRNHIAAKENETLVWRALCDKPRSALKYIAKDAIMSNGFLFGDADVRSAESDPPLEDELKHAQKWLAYKMENPQVVEIDLMAAALTYKLSLFRQNDQGGMESVQATVSSSWRQMASGDWELCSMFAA